LPVIMPDLLGAAVDGQVRQVQHHAGGKAPEEVRKAPGKKG
jgi:hypothetical protein